MVGRRSVIKRNVSLDAAIDRPTLLDSVERAPCDLDLLSDHCRRRKLLALSVGCLLLPTSTILLLWHSIFQNRVSIFFFALMITLLRTFFIFALMIIITVFLIVLGVLAFRRPVEAAIVLVTIEFAGAVALEHLPDVDLRFTLKVHNTVVSLVMHVHEHVHVTEKRQLHRLLQQPFLSFAVSDFSGAIASNASKHLNPSTTHFHRQQKKSVLSKKK